MKCYHKTLIIILLLIAIATPIRAIEMHWIVPNQDGETISSYPQKLQVYIKSGVNIEFCNWTINTMKYQQVGINYNSVELTKEFRLSEGTYTANLSCYDGNYTYSERTFVVDDMQLFRESNKQAYLLIFLGVLYALLLYGWFAIKDKTNKLIISIFLILIPFYGTTIESNTMMWIPIIIGIFLFISSIIKIITK